MRRKEKDNIRELKKNQYWDTVTLSNGGVIRVIKSKEKTYPKGYYFSKKVIT